MVTTTGRRWAAVLACLLATAACSEGNEEDEAVPVVPEATLTLTPSEVDAGSVRDIDIQLENFGDVEVYTALEDSSADVIYLGHVDSTDDGLIGRFFFGLLGEGTAQWGLGTPEVSATDNFEIAPATAPEPLSDGLAAAEGTLSGAGDFAAWSISGLEGQVLFVRTRDLGNSDFEPRMWLLAEDGRTRIPTCCAQAGESMLVMRSDSDAAYYLRIDDAQGGGGEDFSYVLDRASVDPGELVGVDEEEPNNSVEEAQGLGALSDGGWVISGQTSHGGPGDKGEKFGGDLELFSFSVLSDSYASMTLAWGNEDADLDVLLFDGDSEELTLSFDSESIVDTSMATTAPVEQGTVFLEAGRNYVLLVTSFMDVGPSDWTLDVAVVPAAFPGGSR
ncbi:MAG TPA: hypothetical protein DIU15_00150 [Deltaproteobacteria bacterium]|mgnify:CR=1 FL=1|nr:hypothetical protein [Deltaproteobacteria bacterium]HCP44438.1 hypothetical protein [Deltaproteobacteria bacterium]